MTDNERIEDYTFYIMSLVGGFLGAYALLNHHDIFGSALTSTMIFIITDLLGNNLNEFLVRCLALIIYLGGIGLPVFLSKRSKIDIQLFSIILDLLVVFILGFQPKNLNDFIALYPIFFITAVQWNSFSGIHGYASSCIFSTNNIRQFVVSSLEYILDHDKKHLEKSKYFMYTLIAFHIGVGISYLSYVMFGIQGAWVCLLPLLIALMMKTRIYTFQRKLNSL